MLLKEIEILQNLKNKLVRKNLDECQIFVGGSYALSNYYNLLNLWGDVDVFITGKVDITILNECLNSLFGEANHLASYTGKNNYNNSYFDLNEKYCINNTIYNILIPKDCSSFELRLLEGKVFQVRNSLINVVPLDIILKAKAQYNRTKDFVHFSQMFMNFNKFIEK